MQLAFITARQVLILFLMIVAGFVCGKTGAIKPDGKKTLSDLLLYLVMPAMILDSYLIEFDAETFGNLLVSFGLSAALMLGGLAVLRLLGVRGLVADVCLLLEACPTAAVTTVFAVRFAKSEDLAAGAVVFTTLASMIWLPVYALLISAV